jgi:DNA mismatch endonuclease, patch repair protein
VARWPHYDIGRDLTDHGSVEVAPDNLTVAQRSYCMSRVKGRDTGLERRVRSALHRRGVRFRKHVKELSGKPDIVFPCERVAIFIDGDFWHGYRFPAWEKKMSIFWRIKIAGNRNRDKRNFRTLRNHGWRVLRLWQHELVRDLDSAVDRIIALIR